MMMTDKFEVFGEKIAACNWYLLPIEMQRMYLIFLANVQNPILMTSYGGITCERGTSKRVKKNLTHIRLISYFQFEFKFSDT